MRHALVALIATGTLVTSTACKGSGSDAPPRSAAPVDSRHQALLSRFASAIVARDYAAAHGLVAADVRASLTQQELEEAFRHYRDGLPDELETQVEVEAYDREGALLVPEELRGRIDAEGTVHFEPGGDTEGFSAHVWIMQDAGEPRLAHFYVGD